ncbi:hypothetical protein RHSIM_Rhsim01G0154000 [Rhododendron simsii]|uniref:Protein FAR1-RELATED SEQUENCE n=1 Tax=Rhododendron simsii TaxID=118357 RepID=A0A834HGR1_RHOSS|nr:hypothetical protein RHSIM_Rhsim01G0154000 [Rhododendron simsii]
MRIADAEADTATKHSTPVLITQLKTLEKNGTEVYTRYIFRLFQDEIQRTSALIVARYVDEVERRLCARAVAEQPNHGQMSPTALQMDRYGILSSGFNLMSFYASHGQDKFEDAREVEYKITSWKRKRWERKKNKDCNTEIGEASNGQFKFGVGDPLVVKTKGNPGKNSSAQHYQNPRKCSQCKCRGHDKRTCQKFTIYDQSTDGRDDDENVRSGGEYEELSNSLSHADNESDGQSDADLRMTGRPLIESEGDEPVLYLLGS